MIKTFTFISGLGFFLCSLASVYAILVSDPHELSIRINAATFGVAYLIWTRT